VKEILFEERYAMRKAGIPFQEQVELGAVVETPVAVCGIKDLVRESDFLTLGLDSLLQYLLAADRENHELRHYFDALHPVVLRLLREVTRACGEAGRSLSAFGVTAVAPLNLPFLVGVGFRSFCVPPVALRDFLEALRKLDVRSAERAASAASRASCQAETQSLVDGYRHGYARP
jgi:phosphoenolpyruvate-protein kinase (PTS system EI component)